MGFLNAARPLVNENDALVIRVTGAKGGGLTVLIEPHIKLAAPDTDDAELAALQAALAMPLLLRFDASVTDIDKSVADALAGMTTARATTVSALTAYEEAQAEARNQAQLAAKAKADKAKAEKSKGKASAGKPLPAAGKKAAPEDATAPTVEAAPATDAAPPTPAPEPAPEPAPAAQPSMFE